MTKLIYLIILCVCIYVGSLYMKKLQVAKEIATDVADSIAAKMVSTKQGKPLTANSFGERAQRAFSIGRGEAALVLFNDRKTELKVTIRRVVPMGETVKATLPPGGTYTMKLDPPQGKVIVESSLTRGIVCNFEPDSYVGYAFN